MDYAASRHNMIEGQIKTNRVTDPFVIDAMAAVPREAYVPGPLKGVAYIDDAISLGGNRTMLEPMVLARMLDAANLSETDVVLDVACNTGYSTAVMARIVQTVVGLESDEALVALASETLTNQGVDNAVIISGELSKGYAKQAPYDVILVNGALKEIPDSLKEQLSDGGRLVAVTLGKASLSTVSVFTRNGDVFSKQDVFEAGVSELPGFEKETGFNF